MTGKVLKIKLHENSLPLSCTHITDKVCPWLLRMPLCSSLFAIQEQSESTCNWTAADAVTTNIPPPLPPSSWEIRCVSSINNCLDAVHPIKKMYPPQVYIATFTLPGSDFSTIISARLFSNFCFPFWLNAGSAPSNISPNSYLDWIIPPLLSMLYASRGS